MKALRKVSGISSNDITYLFSAVKTSSINSPLASKSWEAWSKSVTASIVNGGEVLTIAKTNPEIVTIPINDITNIKIKNTLKKFLTLLLLLLSFSFFGWFGVIALLLLFEFELVPELLLFDIYYSQ